MLIRCSRISGINTPLLIPFGKDESCCTLEEANIEACEVNMLHGTSVV